MYLIVDTETTGLPRWNEPADAFGQPRIASAALLFVNADLQLEHSWYGLIKPDDWEMPIQVAEINGLTTEILEASGGPIDVPLALYALAIDEGRTVVAHNARFDLKMFRGEMRRANQNDRYLSTSAICTMLHGRKFCSNGKLSTVYRELTGLGPTEEHNALSDAHACLEIFRVLQQRDLHLINLPAAA